jgi:hypothetical protein
MTMQPLPSTLATKDATERRSGYARLFGKSEPGLSGSKALVERGSLRVGQLRHAVRFPVSLPPLGMPIRSVYLDVAQKEVIRSAAARDVALVADVSSSGDRAVGLFPGVPMQFHGLAVDMDIAVTTGSGGTEPNPAVPSPIHQRVEFSHGLDDAPAVIARPLTELSPPPSARGRVNQEGRTALKTSALNHSSLLSSQFDRATGYSFPSIGHLTTIEGGLFALLAVAVLLL